MEFNQHLDSLLTTLMDIVSEKNPQINGELCLEMRNKSPESLGTQELAEGARALVQALAGGVNTSGNGFDMIWGDIFQIEDS